MRVGCECVLVVCACWLCVLVVSVCWLCVLVVSACWLCVLVVSACWLCFLAVEHLSYFREVDERGQCLQTVSASVCVCMRTCVRMCVRTAAGAHTHDQVCKVHSRGYLDHSPCLLSLGPAGPRPPLLLAAGRVPDSGELLRECVWSTSGSA